MIAVTGATGLLGNFIVKKLVEEKFDFIAIKRHSSDIRSLSNFNINWVDSDILDNISLAKAFKGVDTVIHAAALVSFNPRDAEKLMKVNVEGTHNVVNCCLSQGVKRLIHISSVAALGRQKGASHINEESKWIDSPLNSDYGESKYLAELEVYRGHEEGLLIDIINPSVILSQANWNQSSAQLFKYAWKQRPFYTAGLINYIDVRDVVDIVLGIMSNPATNTKFIANAGTIPVKDLLSQMAIKFGKRTPWIKLNPNLIVIGAFFESVLAWITRQEPLITTQSARAAKDKFYYSNKRVVNKLAIKFKPLDETLDWCCDYYRQNATINNQKVQV